MPSKLITPPDFIESGNNILIVDASEFELATLILWLKTVNLDLNLYLYRTDMSNVNWLYNILTNVQTVLLYTQEHSLDSVFADTGSKVIRFGEGTEYHSLIDYFLINQSQ